MVHTLYSRRMEEETILMSDDLQGSVDPASLVDGVAHAQMSFTIPSQSDAPLIGYPPLADKAKTFYFVSVLVVDDETSFAGTATGIEHDGDSVKLQMDMGNEDYFRLLGLGPKTVRFLEVKLTNPLGDQVMLAQNATPQSVKALPEYAFVSVTFEFIVTM